MTRGAMKGAGIYEIVNTATGKRYVGSSRNLANRWKSHRAALRNGEHHSIHLQRAWTKYGEDAFSFGRLELCEINQLLEREQSWIDLLKPEYNLLRFAGSGRDPSLETRARNSAAQKVAWRDPVKRQRLLAGRKLQWLDPVAKETHSRSVNSTLFIEKQRQARLLEWSDPEVRAKRINGYAAFWADPEKRAEAIAARKAAWRDPAIRAERIGRMLTAEARKKNSDSQKAVWADPVKRAPLVAIRKAQWQDPTNRAKYLAAFRDPIRCQKISSARKAWWERHRENARRCA